MAGRGIGSVVRGSTLERVWSTERVPETEQFAFWRDVCGEAFVPVWLTRRTDGPFASTVRARRVGSLAVSKITSQAQSVARRPSEIERQAGEVFFLNMPLGDGSFASQDGRTAWLRSRDFVLIDSTRPFELGFDRTFRQISIAVPHEVIAPLFTTPAFATAMRVPGNRGVGAVASSALRALSGDPRSIDRRYARVLVDHVVGLVALAVGGVRTPPASVGRALLLQAALDDVERTLGDPALSPVGVAERVGISTRYLHNLFADHGTSFCRWVLKRRLERCARDLADPARSHWTIAAVALHHGFNDPSYFARAFRARYGVTPRQYRSSDVP